MILVSVFSTSCPSTHIIDSFRKFRWVLFLEIDCNFLGSFNTIVSPAESKSQRIHARPPIYKLLQFNIAMLKPINLSNANNVTDLQKYKNSVCGFDSFANFPIQYGVTFKIIPVFLPEYPCWRSLIFPKPNRYSQKKAGVGKFYWTLCGCGKGVVLFGSSS